VDDQMLVDSCDLGSVVVWWW